MPNKLTKEVFIERARKEHGEKYDYSLVEYANITTKVRIICPIHGEFWQTPDAHVRGQGCPRCVGKGMNTNIFINRARSIHGNKYDYSKAEYINNSTNVCIICPKHGEFWQTPASHLLGCGCHECAHSAQTKSVYGIEINDSTLSSDKAVIDKWRQMLYRCYSGTYIQEHPTYQGCVVCNEWLRFSNFERWVTEQGIEDIKMYDLDKDLFSNGGDKIYSPNTCCLLPHELNTLLVLKTSKKSGLPRGVYQRENGQYRVILSFRGEKHHTQYQTLEEAFNAYKVAKENHIRNVAHEYYIEHLISRRIYDALLNFEVKR